jgi:long-chain fatty acid transport protein
VALLSTASGLRTIAGGFRLADQDAFATGRGEAFVATADNASAVYYNPAGLTQIEGGNLRGGIYAIDVDCSYRPLNTAPNKGHTYNIEDHLAGVPQMFGSYTFEEPRISLGLGIYAPYGGSVRWPNDTGFRTIATEASLKYYRISPVVAVQVAPGLSIGAGAMIDYADMDLEQGLRPSWTPLVNYFRFKSHGWAPGYNVGVLWRAHEKLSLGATFRSSTPFHLEGQTEFDQPPVLARSQRPASADLTFPMTAVVGLSYRPTPKWNIEFDADYTDWTSFGKMMVHQTAPPYPLHATTPVNLGWDSSWMYELGVTRYFEHGWHASAGYVFSESSVPNKYYTPLASDMDRHFFSLGVGREWEHLSVDLAFQFGYGPERTITGSKPPSQPGLFSGQNADGTYDFMSHAIMLTVGWRF